jgi:hypothetical protein
VSQAADFLYAYRKEYGSPVWSDAMNCSLVKAGASTPDQVSAAFIAAVTEAGIRTDPTLRLY